VPEVDLQRPRGVSDLFGTTFSLFIRHAGLFLSVTLVVVAPVVIVVDGVWGRGLQDGADATVPVGAAIASGLLNALIVPSMVTALHVVIVQRIGSGSVPTIPEAFEAAADRLGAVIATVVLYFIVVAFGFLLLIVPGIWLGTRLYFGAQAAVVDGASPVEALRISYRLVGGRWWRTFGCILLAGLVFFTITSPLTAAVSFVTNGPIFVLATVALNTVSLSLAALFGTLLFFDLRSRPQA
jgi:hypothetical protein